MSSFRPLHRRQAAENRTTRHVADLKVIQHEVSATAKAGDAKTAGLLNRDSHEKIGDMAQNPYLLAGLNRIRGVAAGITSNRVQLLELT
ncbi:MAG: FCD domain-containing protein [Pseudomonadota bacterium]